MDISEISEIKKKKKGLPNMRTLFYYTTVSNKEERASSD